MYLNSNHHQTPDVKFLGVLFDERLTFEKEIDHVESSTMNRINALKILASRKWNLSEKTLRTIYLTLVRSVIEYPFFIVDAISQTQLKRLQRIQNQALRVATRSYHARIVENEAKMKIEPVKERLRRRMDAYLLSNVNNPLIKTLKEEYVRGFKARKEKEKAATPLSRLLL